MNTPIDFINSNRFNEQEERAAIFTETGPQSAELKPGKTRTNAKMFYERRRVHNAAQRTYQDGSTPAQFVDELINTGYLDIELRTYGIVVLKNGNNSQVLSPRNGYKAEAEYASMLFGIGSLIRI